jgi:hypothetical protein
MSSVSQNSTSLKYKLLKSFWRYDRPDDEEIERYRSIAHQLEPFDLHDCAFRAALMGNLKLLRLLHEEVGDVPVVYVNDHSFLAERTMNGLVCDLSAIDPLENIESLADFKELLRTIEAFGYKGLVEPGTTRPLLFENIHTNENLKSIEPERFSGELPYLENGVLRTPELAIALSKEGPKNMIADAYEPILCWASQEMASAFPENLAPLHPFQEIPGIGSMATFKADSDSINNSLYKKIVMGIRPSDGIKHAGALFKYMCPVAPLHGFDDLQGRILCETTVDFLLGFDISASPHNAEVAQDFARTYCPYEIIATLVSDICVKAYGTFPGYHEFDLPFSTTHSGHFNGVFGLLAQGHPLRDRAREMMTPSQWGLLFYNAEGTKLSAQSIIAMQQTFGDDNLGLFLEVWHNDIPAYKAAGYKFSEDTKFFNNEKAFRSYLRECMSCGGTAVYAHLSSSLMLGDDLPSEMTRRDLLDIYTDRWIDVVRLGIWAHDTKPITTVRDAIKAAGRLEMDNSGNNRSMSVRAIMVDAGVDECASVCQSASDWIALTKVFSRNEIMPYLKEMPAMAKGRVLENDLGM